MRLQFVAVVCLLACARDNGFFTVKVDYLHLFTQWDGHVQRDASERIVNSRALIVRTEDDVTEILPGVIALPDFTARSVTTSARK